MPPRNYSENDMARMHQDALRRVQEMQQRANRTLEAANGHVGSWHEGPGRQGTSRQHAEDPMEPERRQEPEPVPVAPPVVEPEPARQEDEPLRQSPQGPFSFLGLDSVSFPFKDILSLIGGDRILIGLLLLLLLKEEGDQSMILALVYLLLF